MCDGRAFPARGSLWRGRKRYYRRMMNGDASKRLPLEGKVPNGCEADEVERESPLWLNFGRKLNGRGHCIAMSLRARQAALEARAAITPPRP